MYLRQGQMMSSWQDHNKYSHDEPRDGASMRCLFGAVRSLSWSWKRWLSDTFWERLLHIVLATSNAASHHCILRSDSHQDFHQDFHIRFDHTQLHVCHSRKSYPLPNVRTWVTPQTPSKLSGMSLETLNHTAAGAWPYRLEEVELAWLCRTTVNTYARDQDPTCCVS